jgi:predicted Zn finger-like uncharacterized protein
MPTISYTCPGCTTRIKTAQALPAGKMIKCPRCAKVFAAVVQQNSTGTSAQAKALAKPIAAPAAAKETKAAAQSAKETKVVAQAKETKLATQQSKETKLAAQAKETKLAAAQAKETKLAAAQAKETKLAAQQAKETKLAVAQAKETRLAAAQAKETKLPAAQGKETKLATPLTKETQRPASPPAGKPTPSKPAAADQPFRIICPKCRVTIKWKPGSPPPLGKTIKCPGCAVLFKVGGTPIATPLMKKPAAPQVAKPTSAPAATNHIRSPAAGAKPVERPVIRYSCPQCKMVLKTPTALPAGKIIQCPRCRKTFAVLGMTSPPAASAPPKPAAGVPKASTAAGAAPPPVPVAKSKTDTKLLLGPKQATPTKPVTVPAAAGKKAPVPSPPSTGRTAGLNPAARLQQAKETKVAGKSAAPTKVQPGARPVGRISCPACKVVIRVRGMLPNGVVIKCPKCAQRFRVRTKSRARVPAKPQAAARPGRRRISRTRRYALFAVGGLSLFCVILYAWMAGFWGNTIPESDWAAFTPPDRSCEIWMPGTPVPKPGWGVPGEGKVAGQLFSVLRKKEGAVFELTISDRDAQVTGKLSFNDFYLPVRDFIVKEKDGTVVKETDLSLNGVPGKELHVEPAEGGFLAFRFFLVRGKPHDRLYILMVGLGNEKIGADHAAKFFDSFKINSPAQPANHPRDKKPRIRAA